MNSDDRKYYYAVILMVSLLMLVAGVCKLHHDHKKVEQVSR